MTYDHELILINKAYQENELGDMVPIEIEKTALCGLKSVTRNEFYAAAQDGINPEIVFVMHNYEYEGEKKVKFEKQVYKVVRTYSISFEEIELTCEKVL